jgi:long-subunit fatty acid transport protein
VNFGDFIETSALRPYINKEIEPGVTGNIFHPYSYLVGLSYAANLTDKFSTGLSVKYAHESLYNDSRIMAQVSQSADEEVKTWADGLVFDFGIRYNTGYRSIKIGASVQNFGANVTYAKEAHPIPMLFRWGIAGNVIGNDALLINDEENRVSVAFDLFQPNDYAQQEHLGVEYEYAEFFALRAGYKFNYDTEGMTFGGGIRQAIGMTKFTFDYAYGSLGTYLGNVHRISVGVRLQ